MSSTFDPSQLKDFPPKPGVYIMKDGQGKILYVGKAKHLRNRVKQYFTPGRDGRKMVPYLTAHVASIDTIVVSSEQEALLVENNLIKKYRPKYNALLKDDKTYFSLMINHKHPWPMIRVVRNKGKAPKGNLYFGPYVHGYAARQTLELLRSLFPLRQCSDRELVSRTRPCILYDIKQCIAPCVAKCTKEEYDHYVKRVIEFLRGHDATILRELKKERKRAAENLEFERAERLHQMIRHIEKTVEQQKVEKAGSRDLDVWGIYREADRVALAQLQFREGKLLSSNDHLFAHNAQEDAALFTNFILQQYADEAYLPHEILLPLELKERETLSGLISEGKHRKAKIRAPLRGDKRALVTMATANAEAKFKRETEARDVREQILMAMEETFHLTNFPETIESYDNSNISGSEPVSAMVCFIGGAPAKQHYRKYKIKTAAPSDDYGALREVLTRRFRKAKEEQNLPDLILIDGGKGHLNLALETLSALDVSTVDLIGVAKEEGRHDRGMTAEQIYLPGAKDPVVLKANSPILFLLQQIRDEAHRFAITFQRQRRSKRSLASALDTIPGIGPVKAKRLLRHFGSWKRILAASEEEWREVKGITKRDIEQLLGRKKDELQDEEDR